MAILEYMVHICIWFSHGPPSYDMINLILFISIYLFIRIFYKFVWPSFEQVCIKKNIIIYKLRISLWFPEFLDSPLTKFNLQ